MHFPLLVAVSVCCCLFARTLATPPISPPEIYVPGSYRGPLDSLECGDYPGPVNKQRCCKLDERGLVCFPSFIVIGPQKGGTTSLIGLLLFNPSFAAPKQKEISYFRSHWTFGPKWYLSQFPLMHDPSKRITGEATPSYIMGWENCERIHDLLPDTKTVMVLRNPIDRAYSEYQMKVRRVSHQQETVDLLDKYADKVYRCLKQQKKNKDLHNCLPPAITSHVRWDKVRATLNRLQSNKNLDDCFIKPPEGRWAFKSLKCYSSGQVRWEVVGELEEVFREEMQSIRDCVRGNMNNLVSVLRGCYQDRAARGISGFFLLRSLYQPHIEHCHENMPIENLLVMDSAELKHNTDREMAKFHSFVGLPPFVYGNVSSTEINNAFQRNYPLFEAMSGWTIKGDYAPLPASLRADLREFFRPYNEKLFAYLGRRFNWD